MNTKPKNQQQSESSHLHRMNFEGESYHLGIVICWLHYTYEY